MSMSMPMPSPGSDETEGSILRDFVNENIAQEQRALSPRSELISQISPRNKVAATEGHHITRRRHNRRHRSDRELAYSEASPDELLTLLVEQEHEGRRLRRALLTAADRIDAESQRVADMERANSEVADRFRILNESRLAAQQDALVASQELRLYQFQLQNAQTEITRAQDVLKVVQTQRDEAEMSATRAREKAHQLHQQRIVDAAREEGRKYGFEAGFKRAHEEHSFARRQTAQQRIPKSDRRRTERDEQIYPQVEGARLVQQPDRNREVVQDNDEPSSPVSSPSRLPLRNLPQANSPEVIRAIDQEAPVPAPAPYHAGQQPPPQMRPPSAPPPEPEPVVQHTPVPPRTFSESSSIPPVQVYKVDIPPTAEIEEKFGPNEFMGKLPHPWVTANEHLEMSYQQQQQMLQEQYDGIFQRPGAAPPRGMPQPAAGSSSKRKESWYKTLRRKAFGRKRKSEVPDSASTVPVHPSQSWYLSKPPVHVRDFAVEVPRPRSSIDSGSTRVSQLGILSTPDPNGGVSGPNGKSGRLGRTFPRTLDLIEEVPSSRENTPIRDNPGHRKSKSEDPQDTRSSTYSNPKAVDEWRRSSASSLRPTTVPSPRRPPTYIRRPAKLTVPEPLAPGAGISGLPRERTVSENTGTSTPSRLRRMNQSSLHVANNDEPEISPGIGITIEAPSRSPTDAVVTPSSSHPGNGYLSPYHAQRSLPSQSIHSAPSFASMGHRSADVPPAQVPTNYSRSPTPSHENQHRTDSRPNSAHASIQNQPSASLANDWSARSPSRISQPLPPDQRVPSRAQSRDDAGTPSNDWFTKSPSRTPQPLPPDKRAPSRAQSRDGAATPRLRSVDIRATPGSVKNYPLPPTSGQSDLGLDHVASHTSLRSGGSYARFDPSTYEDPAYYAIDYAAMGNDSATVAASAGGAASPVPRSRTDSKAASTSSSLSYISHRASPAQ